MIAFSSIFGLEMNAKLAKYGLEMLICKVLELENVIIGVLYMLENVIYTTKFSNNRSYNNINVV